jgi:TolA-binding protein
MKRTERHHLKHNELADFAARGREVIDEKRGPLTLALIAIVVVSVAAIGYYAYRQRIETRADAMLTEAMIVVNAPVGAVQDPTQEPPKGLRYPDIKARDEAAVAKFKATADQYPSTDSGQFARYREAALYMSLGKPAEASAGYQQVIDRAGNNILGQMARLGLAEAQARAGKLDEAIANFKSLADQKDGPVPVDGVLLQLGRVYVDAGKTAEAQQTFNRLTTEFPESQFAPEARQQLDSLP